MASTTEVAMVPTLSGWPANDEGGPQAVVV
jgi:hypothetical protein